MNKPHKHAKWIKLFADGVDVEWREPQYSKMQWKDLCENTLEICRFDNVEFRKKPREFVEGYYPVVDNRDCRSIAFCRNGRFFIGEYMTIEKSQSAFKWIGKPLQEIHWPNQDSE